MSEHASNDSTTQPTAAPTGDATGPNGGDAAAGAGGTSEGLNEDQLLGMVKDGKWDADFIKENFVSKDRTEDLIKERLDRFQKNFVEGLGASSPDEAKSMIEAYKSAEREQMDDLARAEADRDEFKGQVDTYKTRAEAAEQQLASYETAMRGQLEADLKNLDPAVKELLNDKPPLEQFEYINRHRERLFGATAPTPPEHPNRDDAPQSVWDMPDEKFKELQERAERGEKITLPSQR